MDWIAAAVTAEGLRCQTSFDDIKNEVSGSVVLSVSRYM